MYSSKMVPVSLPIVVSKEGEWFVASCPLLDIATQGQTEEEVKENMQNLIQDYFADEDTKKPSLEEISSASVSLMSVSVKLKV
ncbi:MAG: type II toxin-antitoxin system HicB family antitoxin [Candidatus Diapherotrites archaeon]|uniref:Type II toxin-antitoxin system HicB family antitoxin n=1 Tax=Candidatus Iainarchaeum sp. TaxID=3101447 RepID=A0A8T4L2E8_9ARCH|nr:type II toxin-antitoxin system HicB family antitoxin [Candidatus Diapherotrites archaeon]